MSDSFLDRLAGPEKQRIIKRLRSPEAYERLREKVKGPEDLEQELDRAEKLAELHFALESDRDTHEKMKSFVERSLKEEGIDALVEKPDELSEDARDALKEGRFSLAVSSDETLTLLPDGNIHETIPVKTFLLESCVAQLSGKA